MRIELEDDRDITIILSERNLLSLISKLYWDGSKRTIRKYMPQLQGAISVCAEKDEEHYLKTETEQDQDLPNTREEHFKWGLAQAERWLEYTRQFLPPEDGR